MTEDKKLHEEAEALRDQTARSRRVAEQTMSRSSNGARGSPHKALYAAAEPRTCAAGWRRRSSRRRLCRGRVRARHAGDQGSSGAGAGGRPREMRGDKLRASSSPESRRQRASLNRSSPHGISRIPAIGQKLDPNRHQAMMEIPSAEAEPGTIVEEMQPGYMMKDRLLRPALVGVARKPD